MSYECLCGCDCPFCEGCDFPECECKCDLDYEDTEDKKSDEKDDESGW